MRKITPVVESVLKDHPGTRSSDKHLLLWVFNDLGLQLTHEQAEKFLTMPSMETITRVRRKLQEQGLYPATEQVKKARNYKSMVTQQVAPSDSPQSLENHMTAQESLGL